MPFKILIADDNIDDKFDDISRLPGLLHDFGYDVVTTADGDGAYDLVLQTRPDLVLLDIQFGNDVELGFEICAAIRSNDAKIPIVLITAYATSLTDILHGFKMGISDYVVRPRDNLEIVARVRANLPPDVLLISDYLCVDLAGYQVYVKQGNSFQEVDLQRLQFELLKVLVERIGIVVPNSVIKANIWPDKIIADDTVAAYIRHLREKIEQDPSNPVLIETVKGIGYRLVGKAIQISRKALEKLIPK